MSGEIQPVTLVRAPFQDGSGDSHALLYRAAARCSGLSSRSLGPLTAGPWGKPAVSLLPGLHFSLTHSGAWGVCAFSSRPVGLDLQLHRSFSPPEVLSRRFFHPREDAFLARGDYRDFFPLWSAKESYVKLTGRGFYLDPAAFSVVSPEGRFPEIAGASLRLLPFEPEYSLCLCALASPRAVWAAL